MPLTTFLLLLGAAFLGGLANALAGGGTFLVFPALLFAGLDPIVANATSAGAMLWGGIASAVVYRVGSVYKPALLRGLLAASVAGGISGSVLLLITPSARFARLVPFLMLGAALIYTFSDRLAAWGARRQAAQGHDRATQWVGLLLGHYLISVYGGYFGAGMGVLMIVLFLLTANMDVQQSAALRFYCTFGINFLAVGIFAWRGLIHWSLSAPMAVAAAASGYWGAHLVRRMSPLVAKRAVLIYAWITSIWLFFR